MKWVPLLLALLVTGCGGPAADLFEVQRSGTDRNANLTLLVSEFEQLEETVEVPVR